MYEKAVKSQSKMRLAIMGPSGSGKTFTSLGIATELARLMGTDKILLLDSEKGSSAKFADIFSFFIDEIGENQSLETYCQRIKMAEAAGIRILIIDSLSHAWAGRAGALEQLDAVNARGSNPNKMSGWAVVTPLYHRLLDCITGFNGHVICTLRSKTEWVIEEINGKKVPRKVGMAPVMRDGVEYEYDLALEMFQDHNAGILKARVHGNPDLQVGQIVALPGAAFAGVIWKWLTTGAEPRPALQSPQSAQPVTQPTTQPQQPASAPPTTPPSSLPSPVSHPSPAVQPPPAASAAQPQIVPSPRASAPQPTPPPPSSAPSGSAPSAPPQPSPQPTPQPQATPNSGSIPSSSTMPTRQDPQPTEQPKGPDLKQLLRAALGEWCVTNKIPKDKAAHMLFPGDVQTLDAATGQAIAQIASNLSKWYRDHQQLADPATRPNMYRLMVGFQLLK